MTKSRSLEFRPKLLFSIVFTLVFTLCFGALVFAGDIANYPIVKQEKTNWCWAGSSVSILKYKGKSVTQCDYVKSVKGTSTCNNDSGSVFNSKDGLSYYGVSSSYYDTALSWSNLTGQVDSSYPVYVSWGWASGGGHAVVIYGYYSAMSYNYVRYMDPWDGVKTSMLYTNFAGGSGYDRTWRAGLNYIQ